MTKTLTIGIVIGTHRAGSLSAVVARHIAALYTQAGVAVDIIDPAALPAESFLASAYETRRDPNTPLAKRFSSVDALHVIVPEYDGSFPAPLKQLVDIVPYKTSFHNKPIAFIGVAGGNWGGVRAVEHIQGVFAYLGAHLYGGRVFIPTVDDVFAEGGDTIKDADLLKRLQEQTSGFADFARRLQHTA